MYLDYYPKIALSLVNKQKSRKVSVKIQNISVLFSKVCVFLVIFVLIFNKLPTMKLKLFTIPNLITCLNLVSGCIAIERTFSGDMAGAFLFILLAAVFDFLDGFFARLLNSYSEVGKELDSLADVISFGAAPSFVMFNALRFYGDFTGWEIYLVFILGAFSALRLAKFNLDTRQTTEFIGLPTPASTLLVVSLVYSSAQEGNAMGFLLSSPWWLIGLAVVMSLLLVSEIPMFSLKLKSLVWKGNEFRYILVVSALVLLIFFGRFSVPYIMVLYILLSVVRIWTCGGRTVPEEK